MIFFVGSLAIYCVRELASTRVPPPLSDTQTQ
jgi:hypothetical protein